MRRFKQILENEYISKSIYAYRFYNCSTKPEIYKKIVLNLGFKYYIFVGLTYLSVRTQLTGTEFVET